MTKLTDEEELEYARKGLAAFSSGSYEEAESYMKHIPFDPTVAMIMKTRIGIESVEEKIAKGYDFSKAEEKYGKDWLYK